MASTFSPSLRIELIGDGDQSGIWGQTTNTNLGTLIEQAIAGVVTITMVDANYTLTNFNGVSDEARNQVIVATGTNAAVRDIIIPLVEKTYTIRNSTTGGFGVRVIGSSGTGVTIPNGTTTTVYCDGINVFAANTGSTGAFSVNGALTASSGAFGGAVSGTTGTFSGAVSGTSFSGAGTGLTGTASSLSIGGNAGTATNPQSGGSFITSSNIGSQSVSYATTSGTANALNSGTTYTPGGMNVVGKAMFVGTGGGGGDCQVLLDNNGNVGQIAAVNLANNAYRWLQVGVGSPVLIGAAGVAGGASLTVGQSNGNGTIFASSALANNETGFAMVNGDACFGQFYFPNAGNYFAVNLLGSTIGINFFFSDIRSKKDITPTQEEILPLIDKIEFIDYVSKSRKEGEESKQPRQTGGVSAQQLQTIKPTWVEELDDGGLMLNAQLMLTNAYKAIQELSSKVATLEAKIAALEAK